WDDRTTGPGRPVHAGWDEVVGAADASVREPGAPGLLHVVQDPRIRREEPGGHRPNPGGRLDEVGVRETGPTDHPVGAVPCPEHERHVVAGAAERGDQAVTGLDDGLLAAVGDDVDLHGDPPVPEEVLAGDDPATAGTAEV